MEKLFCIFADKPPINKIRSMAKKYPDIESESVMVAAEPMPKLTASHHTSSKNASTRARVMASTVSVDEYFDELISLVHKDYAIL